MKRRLAASAVFSLIGLSACDPIPRHVLTAQEKLADIAWIESTFRGNYAPLEYKEKRFGFSFDKAIAQYRKDAVQTKDNDEFYALLFRLVAQFGDAHTSGSLSSGSLPNRAQVAYLGFSGVREDEGLRVDTLLPTIKAGSDYPIQKDDLITQIDGKPLRQAVKDILLPWRNLGHDEANFTANVNQLFTRISTRNGLPDGNAITLTVVRRNNERGADQTLTISMPWVTKDLYQFRQEQKKAEDESKKAADAAKPEPGKIDPAKAEEDEKEAEENFLMMADDGGNLLFKFQFIGFNGRVQLPLLDLRAIDSKLRKSVTDGFRVVDLFSGWEGVYSEEKPKTPVQLMQEQRGLPKNPIFLSAGKTYPAFVTQEKTYDAAGKETTETKLVGTIYVDTFNPGVLPEVAIAQFRATLKQMAALGVEHLVIDTINNGGGNLVLGMQMAQALSPNKLDMIKMQFRLSDSWLDQFEAISMNGDNDTKRQIAHDTLGALLDALKAGKRLSDPISAEVLSPYAFEPNRDLDRPFKVAVLANEMCASMCDIFSAILQDNKLGIIVGSRTMGAGGNVVSYSQAPNSHLDLRQTESLFVRKDGSYLENNGVTPDVDVAVAKYSRSKYDEVRQAALKALLKK